MEDVWCELYAETLNTDRLDTLIQNTKCIKKLFCLLQLKCKYTNLDDDSTKIYFHMSSIRPLTDFTDIHFGIVRMVLTIALNLAENLHYLIELMGSDINDFSKARLLFNILDYYSLVYAKFNFITNFKMLLHSHDKRAYQFLILSILPKSIAIADTENLKFTIPIREVIWDEVINYSKFLDAISVNIELFQEFLLEQDNIWLFLETCIVTTYHVELNAHGAYILKELFDFQMRVISDQNNISLKKAHLNFFAILSASKETQYYLIEPSLHLLDSIKCLNPIWLNCLFKILLRHSDDKVVYTTVIYILKELGTISIEIWKLMMCAINRHDYLMTTRKVFYEMEKICKRFENFAEAQPLLYCILEVNWVPSALWKTCNHIFNHLTVNYPCDLMVRLWKKFIALPEKNIRNACIYLLLKNFVQFNQLSVNELFQVCVLVEDNKYLTDLLKESKKRLDMQVRSAIAIEENTDYFRIQQKIIYENGLIQIKDIRRILKLEPGLLADYIFLKFECSDRERQMYLLQRLQLNTSVFDSVLINLIFQTISNSDKIEASCNVKAQCIVSNVNSNEIEQLFSILVLQKNPVQNESYLRIYRNRYINNFILPKSKYLLQCCLKLLNLPKDKHFFFNRWSQYIDAHSPNTDCFLMHLTSREVKFYHILVKSCKENLNNIHEVFIKTEVTLIIPTAWELAILLFMKKQNNSKDYHLLEHCQNNWRLLLKLITFCEQFQITGWLQCMIKEFVHILTNEEGTTKNDRIHYEVYNDINRALKFDTKLYSVQDLQSACRLNTLLLLDNMMKIDNACIDQILDTLMDVFRKYYQKNYFPGSHIHLEKLRIVQAIIYFLKHRMSNNCVKRIQNFALDSLTEEANHQAVVKLLQCSLICIMNDNKSNRNATNEIEQSLKGIKIKSANVANCIPIFHAIVVVNARNNQIDDCKFSINELIYCAFGPVFKIRRLAQESLSLLSCNPKITRKFRLCSIRESLLRACKENPEEDKTVHNVFEVGHVEHFSFQYIYYDTPRSYSVTPIEWENLPYVGQQLVRCCQRSKLGCDSVPSELSTNIKNDVSLLTHCNTNIQQKILPFYELAMLKTKNDLQSSNLIVIASLVDKVTNLGGLSRTCEIFKVKGLVVHSIKWLLDNKDFTSLSLSSEKWLDLLDVPRSQLIPYIRHLKDDKGYTVVGLEQTKDSVHLDSFNFHKNTAILVGHEREGIAAPLLCLLDYCVDIPQFGVTRSLNVHVAVSLTIWEYAKQHLLAIR